MKKVEAGIYMRADGLCLRVATRFGSSHQVTVPIASVQQGRQRIEMARTVRSEGGDVSEVWAVWIESQRAERAEATGRAPAQRPRFETVDELGERWLAERVARAASSDSKKSGLSRKHRGNLRPSTVKQNNQSFVRAHLQHPERLGGTKVAGLSAERVQAWLTSIAKAGGARATQESHLNMLRSIVGELPRSDQPDEFPWRKVHVVDPAEPGRNRTDPEKWGGTPGSDPPAVIIPVTLQITAAMRSCGRVVVFLMALLGLRRGEAMGLNLGDFSYGTDGRLYVQIRRQRDLSTGAIYEWTKSNASYRTLPIPRVLEVYLASYVRRYHDHDLRSPQPERADHQLAVTSTGRALDGSFLPVHPSTWARWWNDAVVAAGQSYDEIGFEFRPHHLRRSWISLMLRAPSVLAIIAEKKAPPKPEQRSSARVRIAWLEHQLETRIDDERAKGFHGAAVSAFAGHEWTGQDEDLPASPVTFSHYGRAVAELDKAGFRHIADAVDTIVAFDCPDGLVDEPDDLDEAPVVRWDDRSWLLLHEAAALLDVGDQAPGLLARAGNIRSCLVHIADGDREVPALRRVVWAEDVNRLAERKRTGMSFAAAAEVLHLNRKTLRRLTDDPEVGLNVRHDDGAFYAHLDRREVIELLGSVHAAVLDSLSDGPLSLIQLRRALVDRFHEDPFLARVFPHAGKLTTVPLKGWLQQLQQVGLVQSMPGEVVRRTGREVEISAAQTAVAATPSFHFRKDRDRSRTTHRDRRSPSSEDG